MNTTINATPTDIEYGENEIIDVAVNENATGYIAVRIGERIFSAPIVDGKAKFNITGLNVGNYTNVNVAFYDDSKYANRTYLVNFTVFRVDSTITVKINDTTYPNKAVAEIMISDYANGTINITVGNETKTVLANGGENTIVISNMTKGNQTVTVT